MNIRAITGTLLPSMTKVREKTANHSDADRDPQSDSGGGETKKHHLTEEEIEQVIAYVRELPGFKENNLTLRSEKNLGILVLFIEDPHGKIIRRMPETELLDLLKRSQTQSPSTKGRLLNKSA